MADADSGAGPEESASKAAEETPAGNVEEPRDVDWQLGAPSVGGGDDAATSTPEDDDAAGDSGAVEAEPEADVGGGAEGDSQQVRLRWH